VKNNKINFTAETPRRRGRAKAKTASVDADGWLSSFGLRGRRENHRKLSVPSLGGGVKRVCFQHGLASLVPPLNTVQTGF
jgi:hypothetical protein